MMGFFAYMLAGATGIAFGVFYTIFLAMLYTPAAGRQHPQAGIPPWVTMLASWGEFRPRSVFKRRPKHANDITMYVESLAPPTEFSGVSRAGVRWPVDRDKEWFKTERDTHITQEMSRVDDDRPTVVLHYVAPQIRPAMFVPATIEHEYEGRHRFGF